MEQTGNFPPPVLQSSLLLGVHFPSALSVGLGGSLALTEESCRLASALSQPPSTPGLLGLSLRASVHLLPTRA